MYENFPFVLAIVSALLSGLTGYVTVRIANKLGQSGVQAHHAGIVIGLASIIATAIALILFKL